SSVSAARSSGASECSSDCLAVLECGRMTTPAAARRARQLKERRSQIVGAARTLAETEGWDAVTIRRLADAIEYSQPVLYGHFPQGRTEIVTAVALEGFEEL